MIATKAPETTDAGRAIRWWPPQPLVLFHVLGLSAFLIGFEWRYLLFALASYYVRMCWVTIGYHRYFSHRAFKTSRAFQFVLAFLAMTSMQKGVLWWAAHHRDHHKHSDSEGDLHSPRRDGLFWAHIGWILSPAYNDTKFDRIRDFSSFPELRWLNRHYLVPPFLFFLALFAFGGVAGFVWGGVIGTILLWHGSFTINSLSHRFGRVRYQTSDDSKNNWALALLTCGEGWHNNHHHYQSTANQGWFWWELDLSYYCLRVLSWVRLVRDLRLPPEHIRLGNPEAAPVIAAAASVSPGVG